jgi:c(7)-type cytochrome triheme protein
MRSWQSAVVLAIIVSVSAAGVLFGQDLPKLPADVTLAQSPDSPGKVTFAHASHVGMQAKPDCTQCHPKLFSILKQRARPAADRITHARMEKGQKCGACHNGKAAFGFDNCTSCHR